MSDAPKDETKSTRRSGKKSSARTRSDTGKASDDEQFDGPDRLYEFADSLADDSAADRATEAATAALETWVTFRLAGETFALPVQTAQEILRVSTITRVPHAPYTVRGIINMRGRVVPVVDFRVRLGLPEAGVGPKSRILITSARKRLLGLLVDEVEQVVRLDRNEVAPPPGDVMTEQSEYIVGVYRSTDRLLILLDVERVLQIPNSLQAQNQGQTAESEPR